MRISLWLVDSTRAMRVHGSLTAANDRCAITRRYHYIALYCSIAILYSILPTKINLIKYYVSLNVKYTYDITSLREKYTCIRQFSVNEVTSLSFKNCPIINLVENKSE